MSQYEDRRETALTTITYYLEVLFRALDRNWDEDDEARMNQFIDSIVAEAVTQIKEQLPEPKTEQPQGRQKNSFSAQYSTFRNLLIAIRNDLAVLGASWDEGSCYSFDDPETNLLAEAAPRLTHRQKFHLAKTRIQQINALIVHYDAQSEKGDLDVIF